MIGKDVRQSNECMSHLAASVTWIDKQAAPENAVVEYMKMKIDESRVVALLLLLLHLLPLICRLLTVFRSFFCFSLFTDTTHL